jgi:hypothetical protein
MPRQIPNTGRPVREKFLIADGQPFCSNVDAATEKFPTPGKTICVKLDNVSGLEQDLACTPLDSNMLTTEVQVPTP